MKQRQQVAEEKAEEAEDKSGTKQQPILLDVVHTITAALNAIKLVVTQLQESSDMKGLYKEGRCNNLCKLHLALTP